MAILEGIAVDSETQNPDKPAGIVPRWYQKELLIKAKEENIIVCLETGRGKTLVAVLLLKELSFLYSSSMPNVAVFLAPTVSLVQQQANVIRELSELKVSHYIGQRNGGKGNVNKWKEDICNFEVLVMTPQVLLDVLRHALVKMESIKVLIFDECHHCQKEHPYAQIMKEFYFKIEENSRPKILGMTASPVIRKGKSELQVHQDIDSLEQLLDSKALTVEDLVGSPDIKIVEYDRVYASHNKLESLLKSIYDCKPKEVSLHDSEQCNSRLNKRDFINRLYNDVEYCIYELGLWFARQVVEDAFLSQTLSSYDDKFGDATQDVDNQTFLRNSARFFDERYSKEDFNNLKREDLKPDIVSNKVICLVNLLCETRLSHRRCIVFVERTVTAKCLKSFLSHFFPSIQCGYVVGRTYYSKKKTSETVDEFRCGLIDVLIATNVAEEGLDIKDCSLVIHFNLPTTLRGFIQARGRARVKGSNYVILKDRSNVSEKSMVDTLVENEYIVKGKVLSGRQPAMNSAKFWEAFETETFEVPQTGATLSIHSSVQLLSQYCSMLPRDQSIIPMPKFTFNDELDGIACSVHLPPSAPIRLIVGKPSHSKDVAKKSACFQACIMLYSEGELSEYLFPYSRKKNDEYKKTSNPQNNLGRRAMLQKTVVPAVWALPLNIESSRIFKLHAYMISFSALPADREYVNFTLLLQSPLPETVANMSLKLELRSGRSVICKLEPWREVILNHEQISQAEAFQLSLFSIVVDHDLESLDHFHRSLPDEGWYLLLPVISCEGDSEIDWNKVNKLSSYMHSEHSMAREGSCFAAERFPFINGNISIEEVTGLLVRTEWGKELYCVMGVFQQMNAISPFPNGKYENYVDYFSRCHNYEMVHCEKPLLKAMFLNEAQNFLQHRHIRKDGKMSSSRGKSVVELPSEICYVLCCGLHDSLINVACILPSFMQRLESLLIATQLRDYFSSQFLEGSLVAVEKVLEALTTEKCMEHFSLERLELFGDSFLKFAVSCSLFIHHNAADEGFLTEQRKEKICNASLFKLGSNHGFPGYIRDQLFDPRCWKAPCHPSKFICDDMKLRELHGDTWESKENSTVVLCNKGHRWMKMKTVSDAVEALIGAYLEGPGESAALAFMKFIGIDTSTENEQKLVILHSCKENSELERRINISAIEDFLSYRFKEKGLLVEAFTHASFNNDHGRCYQRLEFLGDSVLDFLITQFLYERDGTSNAGELTDMRSSIVSNESFARITVKHRLDKHLMHCSPDLSRSVDEFIEYSESEEIGDWDGNRCPKVLGDIFEALVGAVFVDVDYDSKRTWQIFGPILEPLISSGKQRLHPVRQLLELCQSYGFVCSKEVSGEGPMTCTFRVDLSTSTAVACNGNMVMSTVTSKDKKSAKRRAAAAILIKLEDRGYVHGSRRKKGVVRQEPPSLSFNLKMLPVQESYNSELSGCKWNAACKIEEETFGGMEAVIGDVEENDTRATASPTREEALSESTIPFDSSGPHISNREEKAESSRRGGQGGSGSKESKASVECFPRREEYVNDVKTQTVQGSNLSDTFGMAERSEESDRCMVREAVAEDDGGGCAVGEARSRLNQICLTRKWGNPSFQCVSEEGPAHDRWFTVMVALLLPNIGLVECSGDPRRTMRAAKDSAAYELLQWLMSEGHA